LKSLIAYLKGSRLRRYGFVCLVVFVIALGIYALFLRSFGVHEGDTYHLSTSFASNVLCFTHIYIDGSLVGRFFEPLPNPFHPRLGPQIIIDASYFGQHIIEVWDPLLGINWKKQINFEQQNPYVRIEIYPDVDITMQSTSLCFM